MRSLSKPQQLPEIVYLDDDRLDVFDRGIWVCQHCHAGSPYYTAPKHKEECSHQKYEGCVYLYGDKEVDRVQTELKLLGIGRFLGCWVELQILKATNTLIPREQFQQWRKALEDTAINEKMVQDGESQIAEIEEFLADCIMDDDPVEEDEPFQISGAMCKYLFAYSKILEKQLHAEWIEDKDKRYAAPWFINDPDAWFSF